MHLLLTFCKNYRMHTVGAVGAFNREFMVTFISVCIIIT